MNPSLLYAASILILLVAAFHSFAGQKKLIGPMLSESNSVLDDPTWRAVILFGWHCTSLLMILLAIFLAFVASGLTAGNAILIGLIGISFIGMGIANAVMAKLKHPGWVLLSGIGIISILALYI